MLDGYRSNGGVAHQHSRFGWGKAMQHDSVRLYVPGFNQETDVLRQWAVKNRATPMVADPIVVRDRRRGKTIGGMANAVYDEVVDYINLNPAVRTVTLVGHSLGALYARTALMRLHRNYKNVTFHLEEVCPPAFAYGTLMHSTFWFPAGLYAVLALLWSFLIFPFSFIPGFEHIRGMKAQQFTMSHLFYNGTLTEERMERIHKRAPRDSGLTFVQLAFFYPLFARLSEVERARRAGWKGNHTITYAEFDRVFLADDTLVYATRCNVTDIRLLPSAHCPFSIQELNVL